MAKIVTGSKGQGDEVDRRRDAEANEAMGGKATRASQSAAVAARLAMQRRKRARKGS